jgi:hypothetical protein
VLHSGSSAPEIKIEEPHYRRGGIATTDVKELLEFHRRQTSVLVHRGEKILVPWEMDICRKIVETEWNTVYGQTQMRDFAKAAITFLTVLLFVGIVIACLQSTWFASAMAILAVFAVQQGLRLVTLAVLMLKKVG